MRRLRAFVLLSGLAACHFSIDSVDLPPEGPRDMAPSGNSDMPGGTDMACGAATCPFGCVQTPTPHCRALQPSGVIMSSDFATAGLTVQTSTGNVVIDTTSGAISGGITRAAGTGVIGGISFRKASQSSGPDVGVFSVAGLTLASGQTLTFTGGNAFALASTGNVVIGGAIDGACHQGTPGPGGSGGGAINAGGGGLGGGSAGPMTPMGASGGGGGGFGDVGGTGAPGQGILIGTGGGNIWSNVMASGALVLVGGSGGGAGGGPSGGVGGGGGGAIQLSINGSLTVSGTIDVSGCGGKHPSSGMDAGGGGGSGGAIVLEAAQISLSSSAILSSNGGGGGGGGDISATDGSDGSPGSTPAPNGKAGGGGGGDGGAGGARGPQAGVHNTEGTNAKGGGPVKFGGGGGGGTGRILFRSLTAPSSQAKIISPDFSDINFDGQKMTISQTATFN
jgi:hypothetical protein